jgi:hypothetical protein
MVLAEVRGSLKYLGRLKGRMEKRGFHPSDPIFESTTAAYDAIHALSVNLHYLSCDADKRPIADSATELKR